VAFHDRHVVCPAADVALLVDAAVASRDGSSAPYAARCGSTYVRAAGQWQLVSHHQTPARPDEP
jgi:hypothetical protein